MQIIDKVVDVPVIMHCSCDQAAASFSSSSCTENIVEFAWIQFIDEAQGAGECGRFVQ